MPNVPSSYEVNWQLVTGNGSLKSICSLSNRYLLPRQEEGRKVLYKLLLTQAKKVVFSCP
jgi:hypothetical protein